MRLIDADVLETKSKTIYMEFENVAVPTRVISIADLHLAPAVDAEPVRHGAWIDGRPYVNSRWKVCSVCKECAPEPHAGYEYCPNCGAKMDAEVEG